MRKFLPKSLIGQLALVMAVALLIAQAINFTLVFNERQRWSRAQTEGPVVSRFVLLARIKAVLRRAGDKDARVRAPDSDSYGFGPWVLRSGERELVDQEGVAIPLSTGEYNILHALVTRPRRVLSREQLLDLTQGRELAAFERSIDNHISRLRKKIEVDPSDPKLIKTVWGGGYMLAAEVRKL